MPTHENQPSIAQRIALWAEILRGCSASGLNYAPTIYDQDNYRKFQDMAIEMLAASSGQSPLDLEPLRATLFTNAFPLPVSDAAVMIAATPGMHITAIVTSHPQRQKAAHERYPEATICASAEELWSHPNRYDLVIIATPHQSHLSLGLAAQQAGLPVVIDKPLATSATDAAHLCTVSQQTGTFLTTFHNCRWDGYFLTIQALLHAHLLGPITRYESRYERFRPLAQTWREQPLQAGGLLYDIGSHVIDQALCLFGTPQTVYAELDQRRSRAQVDDDTFVALEFADGIHAHLWMSSVACMPGPRIRLAGLNGTYERWGMDPQKEALMAGKIPGSAGWGQEPQEQWGRLSTTINGLHFDGQIETLPGAYQHYYPLVLRALLDGAPPHRCERKQKST